MNDPMVSVADAMAERHAKLLDEALRIHGSGENDPVQAFAMQRDDEGVKYYLGGKLILAISHLELRSSQDGGRLVSSCNLYPPKPPTHTIPMNDLNPNAREDQAQWEVRNPDLVRALRERYQQEISEHAKRQQRDNELLQRQTELELEESLAQIVYEQAIVPTARHCSIEAPKWVVGGNSLAQDNARVAARAIIRRWPREEQGPTDFDKLPDGFYWITHKACPSDRSLIRLYTNPDTAQRGVGFGIWDGSAFVPLSDLTEHTVLTIALPLPQEWTDA